MDDIIAEIQAALAKLSDEEREEVSTSQEVFRAFVDALLNEAVDVAISETGKITKETIEGLSSGFSNIEFDLSVDNVIDSIFNSI